MTDLQVLLIFVGSIVASAGLFVLCDRVRR
jgi:hypothetical protein